MKRLAGVSGRLPHRFPFLLIDAVLELEEGVGAKGIKCVTAAENCPAFVAVLAVECMAQLAGIALWRQGAENASMRLAGIRRAEFFQTVEAGDVLHVEVRVSHKLGNLVRIRGTANTGAGRVADAEMTLYAGMEGAGNA